MIDLNGLSMHRKRIINNMNKALVVSATRHDKESTTLYNSGIVNDSTVDLLWIDYNELPLAKIYNDAIIMYKNEYDYIVFVHDDVFIPHGTNLHTQLDYFNSKYSYDVMGLAGAKTFVLQEPALWHLMSKREDHRGAVSHYLKRPEGYPVKDHNVTSFGPMPDRVLGIDGLFIALRCDRITDGMRFDESNPGKWHLYDLDFCLTVNRQHRSIGVVDIPVVHESPGLLDINDASFQQAQRWFLTKWNKQP